MSSGAWATLCLIGLGTACNVASVQEQKSTVAQNHCASDSDCAPGLCSRNECRSNLGTFETMLFEVTPPADASSIAGVQFFMPIDQISTSGGELDLPLQLLAQLVGEVKARNCATKAPTFDNDGVQLATAGDGSIPALVSLSPSAGSLGVFTSRAVAPATIANSISFQFSINVPPGQYDIYVRPQHQPDSACVVPPELLRGQTINGGAHRFDINLPEPSSFDLHVSWPLADGALEGWVVDMLDPETGRVLSNTVPLALERGGKSYIASLSYLTVVGGTSKLKAAELVRLSPPPGVPAPSVLLERSALSLFSANSGTLSQFTAMPVPVTVEGQVTALTTPTPVPANVTLVATKINGIDPGVLASFVRTATAGADGKFTVDLLPGSYRVSAVPSGNSALAQATAEWVVADAPSAQAGKVIELVNTLPINGQAFDSTGATPIAGAQVQMTASPASIQSDVLHVALGETVSVPRAVSGIVQNDGSGTFSLTSDSGTFDLSVRPQASTGFAWLVRPNLEVGVQPATSAGVGLSEIMLPLPVPYAGHVTLPGALPGTLEPVPGALIRAYIYMSGGAYTADPTIADSVLQIAETRSDENGAYGSNENHAYDLLIPAALNAANPP
jgi:hypothetical protein